MTQGPGFEREPTPEPHEGPPLSHEMALINMTGGELPEQFLAAIRDSTTHLVLEHRVDIPERKNYPTVEDQVAVLLDLAMELAGRTYVNMVFVFPKEANPAMVGALVQECYERDGPNFPILAEVDWSGGKPRLISLTNWE